MRETVFDCDCDACKGDPEIRMEKYLSVMSFAAQNMVQLLEDVRQGNSCALAILANLGAEMELQLQAAVADHAAAGEGDALIAELEDGALLDDQSMLDYILMVATPSEGLPE